jgi:hypothetical protein
MQSAQRRQEDAVNGSAEIHGLVLGVLAAMVFILVVREAPITTTESVMLVIAAVCEVILLRPALRKFDAKGRFGELLARAGLTSQRSSPRPSFAKQALTLSALVATYLHYYFWDVQLQIASLNSVTVFVPVTMAG